MKMESDNWIPVTERLPADNEPVLISDGKWTDGGFIEDGVFYWLSEPQGHGEVLAWKPPPKPYQPEEEK